MVKDFYARFGFEKVSQDADGNTVWEYRIPDAYEGRNHVIEVER